MLTSFDAMIVDFAAILYGEVTAEQRTMNSTFIEILLIRRKQKIRVIFDCVPSWLGEFGTFSSKIVPPVVSSRVCR